MINLASGQVSCSHLYSKDFYCAKKANLKLNLGFFFPAAHRRQRVEFHAPAMMMESSIFEVRGCV